MISPQLSVAERVHHLPIAPCELPDGIPSSVRGHWWCRPILFAAPAMPAGHDDRSAIGFVGFRHGRRARRRSGRARRVAATAALPTATGAAGCGVWSATPPPAATPHCRPVRRTGRVRHGTANRATRRAADRRARATAGRLVHLDVRSSNLRCTGGAVRGLLDWSNALIGDPAMELGRLAEYALLPENGLDYEVVLAGYREPAPVEKAGSSLSRMQIVRTELSTKPSPASNRQPSRQARLLLRQAPPSPAAERLPQQPFSLGELSKIHPLIVKWDTAAIQVLSAKRNAATAVGCSPIRKGCWPGSTVSREDGFGKRENARRR